MKNFLLLAAVAVLANPAFASKARMTALGNADHLVDPQTAFDNVAHLTQMGDYVTFEGGPTNNSGTVTPGTTTYQAYEAGIDPNPQAEGGFVKSHGDTKYGLYFGRKSPFTDAARRAFGFLRQENTIELQYAQKGDMNWGVGFNYSSSDVKSAAYAKKQQAMGVRLGAMQGNWEAYALIGLGSTASGNISGAIVNSTDANGNGVIDAADVITIGQDADSKYTGTTGLKVGGAYKMDTLRIYGKYYMDGFKYESTTAYNTNAAVKFGDTKIEQNQIDLGVIDAVKMDSGHWFYGAAVQMYNSKMDRTGTETKTTATYLPFIAGIEHEATNWLVLRSAVTQNVLLGTTKTETTGTASDANTITNNTKLAAGLGLKFNKWAVDGSWAASTTGNINTASLMTNVGMTYNF